MFAPKGTPREIVDKLNAAANAALDDPATKGKLEAIGAVIPRKENRTSDGLKKFVGAEIGKFFYVCTGYKGLLATACNHNYTHLVVHFSQGHCFVEFLNGGAVQRIEL
jgi:hypothetical protein